MVKWLALAMHQYHCLRIVLCSVCSFIQAVTLAMAVAVAVVLPSVRNSLEFVLCLCSFQFDVSLCSSVRCLWKLHLHINTNVKHWQLFTLIELVSFCCRFIEINWVNVQRVFIGLLFYTWISFHDGVTINNRFLDIVFAVFILIFSLSYALICIVFAPYFGWFHSIVFIQNIQRIITIWLLHEHTVTCTLYIPQYCYRFALCLSIDDFEVRKYVGVFFSLCFLALFVHEKKLVLFICLYSTRHI